MFTVKIMQKHAKTTILNFSTHCTITFLAWVYFQSFYCLDIGWPESKPRRPTIMWKNVGKKLASKKHSELISLKLVGS